MKDPYKSIGSKTEKNLKKDANKDSKPEDEEEKQNAMFNKYISNLTAQPVRDVIKTAAISKYKQYIRELKRKIELCVFENEKLTAMYNDILTKDINTENRKLRQNLYEMTQMYNQLKDELNSVQVSVRESNSRNRPASAKSKKEQKESIKQEREALDKDKGKYELMIQDCKALNDENRSLKENFNRLSLENQNNKDNLQTVDKE